MRACRPSSGSARARGTINIGSQPIMIGAHTLDIDRNWFNGTMDEVKIYNYSRTQNEIRNDMLCAPVGGIYIPANKLSLLAPYIGLAILLAVAVMTVVYVKKRKSSCASK